LVESGLYRCLCWNDNGDGVVITSKDSIVDIVLPNHFNTREFASFTRQFHIYGFRRVTDNRKAKHSAGHCEFTHPWFKRGKDGLLYKIVR
ncbi:winged helix DNA-binding domain-containing protein, partial [Coemansia reversa NRRL 1564]